MFTNEDLGVLRRLQTEASVALLNVQILKELPVEVMFPEGPTRLSMIHLALDQDTRIRLCLLLDTQAHARNRSFVNVMRIDPFRAPLAEAANVAEIDLTEIAGLAERLRVVRDKTLMHIDLDAIEGSRKLWKEAGIKGTEVRCALRAVWNLCDAVYPMNVQQAVLPPVFHPKDRPLTVERMEPGGLIDMDDDW